MKLATQHLIKKAIAVTALFCMTAQPSLAALLNLAQAPLITGANVPPIVMLNIAKDHQLHYKAYTDYSDLDGDGVLDITYKHSITYYGYFDSFKCYNYNTGTGRFEPASITADKYCAGNWSGNFLNWVSMTRMDTVRKLLFGGLRSTDSSTLTVLERSYLPNDAHAFSKFYSGLDANGVRDIQRLTPFDAPVLTARNPTTSASSITISTGPFPATRTFTVAAIANLAPLAIGDAVKAAVTAAPANFMIGRVSAISGSNVTIQIDVTGVNGAGTFAAWTIENFSQTGISFCNVTVGSTSGANSVSHTNTNPPLLKAARGDFSLWNSMEHGQCLWNEDTSPSKGSPFNGARWNGNLPGASGLNSNAGEPSIAAHRLGGTDFTVRVEACRSTLLGQERCKQYPSGNFKPIGLLQEFGEPGLIQFGLMTGSYTKNKSGGVLRKNPGVLTNEINTGTDGTFTAPPAAGHIIGTLSRLRIYGFNYPSSDYAGADNCPIFVFDAGTATDNRSEFTEGKCGNWGNPMSEIYLESLRYFAGAAATPAFQYTSVGSKDAALGLPLATFTNGATFLNNSNFCAPLNVINFNAAVSSFDGDQFTSASVLAGAPDAAARTDAVGVAEVITGNQFFVGKIIGAGATPSTSNDFEICTAKTVPALGQVLGICSEAPALEGSYLMAGLAHYARTNRIRTDLAVPGSDTKSLKVTTYGITLSSNIPQIPLKNPSNLAQTIATILPAYRPQVTMSPSGVGAGAMVDFRVVPGSLAPATGPATGTERGAYYVNWEVSQHGADYDSDAWGVIRYCVKTATNSCGSLTATSETVGNITITTDLIATAASGTHGFGYIISGTTRDGAHYHSGGLNFNYSYQPPTGPLTAECVNCNVINVPTSQTYTPSATPTAGVLPDPLAIAAKYGAFVDSNGNNLPDLQSEWDSQLGNGVAGQDGIPDTYFLVTNPLGLEAALNRAFIAILANASASSVATNSTSLQTGSAIYQARFNANDWSGQVLAFPVNLDGTVSTNPTWDAGQVINGQDPNSGRVILTYNTTSTVRDGVAFRWPANPASPGATDIPPALITNLNTYPTTGINDGLGQLRLNYLRGDPSQEGTAVTSFRQRPISKLGDVINSSPNFVGPPNAGIGEASYATFRLNNLSRAPMIYVGGNDGMLHAFRASDGQEVLAYIPSKSHANLNKLTSKTYVHRYFVDGTPEVGDAFFGGQWRTVLVSGLAAGGQGVLALDITNPALFTEANAGSIALWEFNDTDDADLGYVTGEPKIRKMKNGRWAAIVSGGYNNSEADGANGSGNAVLFILFLDGPTGPNRTWVSGTDYIKINTGVGSPATPNGLAQPFPADINADGLVDFVYAGDLQGNLHKFDLRDANIANWTAASNQVILFSAKDSANNAEPITAAVEGTLHPTGQGFIITFGTGKFLEPTDPSAPYLAQSFYGIWDKNDGATVSVQTTVTSRTQLLQQTVNDVVVGTNTFRVVSNNSPAWSTDTTPPVANDSPTKHMGWYMDFPNSTTTGERSVFRPILTAGRLIFTTLVPSTQTCVFGGTSFLMVLDPATGARIAGAVIDVDANGLLNTADQVMFGGSNVYASGVQSTIGITPTPTIVKATGSTSGGSGGSVIFGTGGSLVAGSGFLMAYALAAGSSGGNASTMIGLSASGGRVSWRELQAD